MFSSAERKLVLDARDLGKYTLPILVHNGEVLDESLANGQLCKASERGWLMIANDSHPALVTHLCPQVFAPASCYRHLIFRLTWAERMRRLALSFCATS